jgi:hypothetical protein
MSLLRFPDESLDVERSAFTGVKRRDALVNLGSEATEFLDVRQQIPADLFLIGIRQTSHFGDSLFQNFDHAASIPYRSQP